MLYGTYTWEKKYINEHSNELDLKIKLVLNADGTATYNASSGCEAEATKGSYVYEDEKIKYTKEYFYYSGQEPRLYTDNDYKVVTFIVIDKNTLQNNYYGNITSLKK